MIEILNSGLLSTVQSGPRKEYLNYGVGRSGFMDERSACITNWLAGNELVAPLIEVFGSSFGFRPQVDCYIGVTGAVSDLRINGKSESFISTIHTKKDDHIELINKSTGNIFYVSFSGGLKVNEVLGSASTHLSARLGGRDGQTLKTGQILELGSVERGISRRLPQDFKVFFPANKSIRIIKGPDWDLLDRSEQDKLLSHSFEISSDSNRVGYRLKGKKLETQIKGLPSRVVMNGIIQLPLSGEPIVLMSEAPTMGGYPRIGRVIHADFDQLAQTKPGGRVRFALISPEEARQAFREYQSSFDFVKT